MLKAPIRKIIRLIMFFFILFISCKQDFKFEKKSYKGYGMFYYYNRVQDGYRELFFIPVSNPESLVNLKDINSSVGFSFISNGNESFINSVFEKSNKVKLYGRENENITLKFIYYTPVYIEYILNTKLKEQDIKKYKYNDLFIFNNHDTLKVDYYPTQKNIQEIINIKKINIIKME